MWVRADGAFDGVVDAESFFMARGIIQERHRHFTDDEMLAHLRALLAVHPELTGALIRTNNPMERLNREVRRRTRVVGAFPDGQSALMLVAARLRHVAGTRWGTRKYLDMSKPRQLTMDRTDGAATNVPQAAAA